jgi:uncharacterized membrane protein YgcG
MASLSLPTSWMLIPRQSSGRSAARAADPGRVGHAFNGLGTLSQGMAPTGAGANSRTISRFSLGDILPNLYILRNRGDSRSLKARDFGIARGDANDNNLGATPMRYANLAGGFAIFALLAHPCVGYAQSPQSPTKTYPAAKAPAKSMPAAQVPSKVAPTPRAPVKIAMAPRAPSKSMPTPQAPSKSYPMDEGGATSGGYYGGGYSGGGGSSGGNVVYAPAPSAGRYYFELTQTGQPVYSYTMDECKEKLNQYRALQIPCSDCMESLAP